MIYQIKQTVLFPEQTTVLKEKSNNALFDIIREDILDNTSYCQELMNKIFKLPYAQLPDFFSYQCNFVFDPVKWLNKTEKLIAENEELFVISTTRSRMIKCYTVIESKRKEIKSIRFSSYHKKISKIQDDYASLNENFTWTSSKTSLIELIYALYSQGVFDNGNKDIKQIAEYFEKVFNINLGDFYHTYMELKSRKINRTKFIDTLRESLMRKMEEQDER